MNISPPARVRKSKPSELPDVKSPGEWLHGYWQGIFVGICIGCGAGVLLVKGFA